MSQPAASMMPSPDRSSSKPSNRRLGGLATIVGLLAVVEFTSGILQGFYGPLWTDIARSLNIHDADVNWFEGTQLMLSALAVPALAKLGDIYGYRRVLLWSLAVTGLGLGAFAVTSSFALALFAWTVAGVYSVWLPLEIALIWARSAGSASPAAVTRRAAGLLVAALEFGAIAGALSAGQLVGVLPLGVTLAVPAVAVALCFVVVLFGVKNAGVPTRGAFDTPGFVVLALALVLFTGGLSLLRLRGPGDVWPWLVIVVGIALLWPFARMQLRQEDPLIDVRMFRSPALGPVFITAGLFGVSMLGAQVPMSTFARTDPTVYGYGWGASSGLTSVLIGIYLISLVVGALVFPLLSRLLTPRRALVLASLLVGIGYLLFLPLHGSLVNGLINLSIAGFGSGALVAALPAAAASAAPAQQTGVATGLTNSIKTVGGAIASAVFAIALLGNQAGAGDAGGTSTAGSFSGYVTVWVLCGVTALVSAAVLAFIVPRTAFQDRQPDDVSEMKPPVI